MSIRGRELSVSGPIPEGLLLMDRFSGREQLGEPFVYDLVVLSESREIDPASLVGETLTVSVDIAGQDPRYFNGYVTRIARVGTFGGFATYQVTLRPWLWLMSARKNARIYQDQSVPEIAKALFREHGFGDFDDRLARDYPAREFVVQYDESDLAFVTRLLEHAGIYYYFQHEKDRHVLVLADGIKAHDPISGYETVAFHPEGAPTPMAPEFISSWEPVLEWRPGAYASRDFDFSRPRADLTGRRQADARHKRGDLEVFEYPAGYMVQGEVETFVRDRLEALQTDVQTATGSGDVRGLGAGDLFTLTEYPVEAENKEYLVVGASFDAANSPHETGVDEGAGHFHFSFSVIDSKVPFRPALSPRPRVEGPQTAIVVGPSGQEIWTDKYGRVKVQFHWDRDGQNDEKSSCWVRVAQAWAGSSWGAVHIPRIGQEVVVEFLEGDPDRPLITGRVYNGDNMPPYALPDNKTQSGIKSRSTPGGGPSDFNEIRLEDKKGSEEIHVQAQKDLDVHVKHDERRTVAHDQTIHVTNNRSLTVDVDEAATVHGDRTATVDGTEKRFVKTDRSAEIRGSESLVVHADRSETIDGNDIIHVSKDRTLTVDHALKIVQGSTTVEWLDGHVDLQAGSWIRIKHSASEIYIDEDGKVHIATTNDIEMTGQNISISGQSVGIEASKEIRLSAGTGSVKLDAEGATVGGNKISSAAQVMNEITGMMVKVN